MKIGIFGYNFKHWKTQTGIQNMFLNGFKPEIVFAADKKKLKTKSSKLRTSPRDLFLLEPKAICNRLKIDYLAVDHDSEETGSLIDEKQLDLGVVLGARILKKNIIDKFKIGIINLHPGILPENRGLDTIKWAITHDLPQGVTSHFINQKIDMGLKINYESIIIYRDDTLLDLKIRLQNLEQKMLIESLKIVSRKQFNINNLKSLKQGKYHSTITPELEEDLLINFEKYKIKWSKKQ